MNVLHFAAQNDKNEIVDYLLKELQLSDLNIKDKVQFTASITPMDLEKLKGFLPFF